MIKTQFITSECGNSPEEAWSRAIAQAKCENINKRNPHGGILDKEDYEVVEIHPEKSLKETINLLLNDISPSEKNAFCVDAGEGEYYFFGSSFLE